MKLSRDIQSMSVFKRDTAKFLKQLKKTGQPIILTVNGKAAAVIHDPDQYQDYLTEKERMETIAAIKRGLADIDSGRVIEAEDLFSEIEAEFGFPRD